jgi:hypothetical protein
MTSLDIISRLPIGDQLKGPGTWKPALGVYREVGIGYFSLTCRAFPELNS